MKKRLSAHNSLLMKADCITLKNAKAIDILRTIIAHFPNIIQVKDSNSISNELERLDYQRADLFEEIRYNLDNPILVWRKQLRDFPLVYKFVRALDLLPYSTASVERNFSWMNDTKTAKRNRLSVSRLEAILY